MSSFGICNRLTDSRHLVTVPGLGFGIWQEGWSMLEVEKPCLVVAFHDDISSSRGTKDMIARARRGGAVLRSRLSGELAASGWEVWKLENVKPQQNLIPTEACNA